MKQNKGKKKVKRIICEPSSEESEDAQQYHPRKRMKKLIFQSSDDDDSEDNSISEPKKDSTSPSDSSSRSESESSSSGDERDKSDAPSSSSSVSSSSEPEDKDDEDYTDSSNLSSLDEDEDSEEDVPKKKPLMPRLGRSESQILRAQRLGLRVRKNRPNYNETEISRYTTELTSSSEYEEQKKRARAKPRLRNQGTRTRSRRVTRSRSRSKSPMPELVPTRFSARLEGRQKPVSYNEYSSSSDSDDYIEIKAPVQEEEEEEEKEVKKVIDKLIYHKMDDNVLKYLAKWKNQSYLHNEWLTEEEILSERFGKTKIARYWRNPPSDEYAELDEDKPFNPDFVQVDRILDHRKATNSKGEKETQYYVKWESLPYSACTWEFASDINDDNQIQIYKERNKAPPPPPKNVSAPVGKKFKKYEKSPEFKNGNELRSYQLEGVNWIVFNYYQRQNCILADEMGLGKTVQSVSTIWHIYKEEKIRGPFLVIAPLSTIQHWRREFEEWTDLNVIVYHGDADSREIIRRYEFYYKGHKERNFFKWNVLITTYEMVLTDSLYLKPIEWQYVVIDEAHRLKNKNCKLLIELENWIFEDVLLLTGTPLQNNTEELWTLLNFLEPNKFVSLSGFLEQFGELKEHSQVTELHEVLKPHLLRRMKENVEKSIAPKEETIVEVELTVTQKKYYKAIYERNFGFLAQGCTAANTPSLRNIMMQLRKCCNHPYLIKGAEQSVLSEVPSDYETINQMMIKSSGKLVLIDKLLPKLKAGGHKVLIFSQMVRVLDILEDYLHYRNHKYERIDGGIRGNDRQEAIDRFCRPGSDKFIFLLCTRAGGVGINLTAADTVIIYDSDWNPQNDIQAQARCHRIGQEKMVKVYRLITRNTYERHMFEKASLKLGLDQAVLGNMTKKVGESKKKKSKALDKKAIDSLLKYGAYDMFREGQDDREKYDEEDIDKILERASYVLNHDTPDAAEKNLFAKAHFCSSEGAPDVALDDPDFWKKILPAHLQHAPDPRIISSSRVRKRVRRFGQSQNNEMDLSGDSEDDDAYQEGVSDDAYDNDTEDKGSVVLVNGQELKAWSKTERQRLKSCLITLGYGRWEDIKRAGKLTRRSLLEIELFSASLIRLLFLTLQKQVPPGTLDWNQFLLKVWNAAGSEKESRTPIEVKLGGQTIRDGFLEQVEENSEPQEAHQSEIKEENETTKTEVNTEAQGTGKMPTDKATTVKQEVKEKDEALNQEKGKGKEKLADEAVPNKDKADKQNLSEEEPETDTDEKVELRFRIYANDPSIDGAVFSEYLTRNARKIVKSLEDVTIIGKKVRSCGGSIDKIKDTLPSIPHPLGKWWEAREDANLLYGLYKHGVGHYDDIRADPELCFHGRVQPLVPKSATDKKSKKTQETEDVNNQTVKMEKETTQAAQQSADLYEWPIIKRLNLRVKRLIRVLGQAKQVRKSRRSKKKENSKKALLKKETEKLLATGTVSFKKKPGLVNKWSKRERDSFFRTIIAHGVPSDTVDKTEGQIKYTWEEFRKQGNFTRKDTDMLEEYYVKFLEVCRKKSKNSKYKGEGEVDPVVVTIASNLAWKKSLIAMQHVFMFGKLRSQVLCLPDKELTEKLNRARPISHIPSWWVMGKHDKGLLLGVVKHGFGKWDLICDDEELPFLEVANQKRSKLTSPKPEHVSRIKWITPGSDKPELQEKTNIKGMEIEGNSPQKGVKEEKVEQGSGDGKMNQENTNNTILKKEKCDEETEEKGKEEKMGNEDGNDETTQKSAVNEQKKNKKNKEEKKKEKGKLQTEELETKPTELTNREILRFPRDRVCLARIEYLIKIVLNPDQKPISEFFAKIKPGTRIPSKQQKMDTFFRSDKKRNEPKSKDITKGSTLKRKRSPSKLVGHTKKRAKTSKSKIAPNQKTLSAMLGDKKSYLPVPMDESGQPILPFPLSANVKLISLGKIVDPAKKPLFHVKKYIYPAGFRTEKYFLSYKNPGTRCWYTNEIIEETEDPKPIFKVTAADDPENPSSSRSATGAWSTILRRIKESKPVDKRRCSTSVSGPEYFSLANNTILKLIQDLPGAEKCTKYERKTFQPTKKRRLSRDREPREKLKTKRRKLEPGIEGKKSDDVIIVESNRKSDGSRKERLDKTSDISFERTDSSSQRNKTIAEVSNVDYKRKGSYSRKDREDSTTTQRTYSNDFKLKRRSSSRDLDRKYGSNGSGKSSSRRKHASHRRSSSSSRDYHRYERSRSSESSRSSHRSRDRDNSERDSKHLEENSAFRVTERDNRLSERNNKHSGGDSANKLTQRDNKPAERDNKILIKDSESLQKRKREIEKEISSNKNDFHSSEHKTSRDSSSGDNKQGEKVEDNKKYKQKDLHETVLKKRKLHSPDHV